PLPKTKNDPEPNVKEEAEDEDKEMVIRHLLEASDDELGIPNRVANDDVLDVKNGGFPVLFSWRFKSGKVVLFRVIKALYGETGSVDGNVNSGPKSCWMNIVKEVNSLVVKGIDLRNPICFKLGNGEKARFWEDIKPRWGVEQEQFEELWTLVNDIRLVPMGDRWTWNLSSSGEFSVSSVKSNSLPTRFNISRRGIPLDSIKCGFADMGAKDG
ncbi:hypothetical protein Tco_1411580, partial [Tanacetum coccineum]